ncbi:hypothetical protein Pcinc_010127 [Petrolisthes cinctipes]|uniref:leucine--tRNA ligase n=1 Tax=Petrolisthes cinctipes TaxID=88211 RepID=A0AAE1KXQ3_PETCI|nr:hypothetical protein Pcinc_010127 [Petrolisthes cinctipes]
MDHDRSSGEGVGPQEYTLIKMRVQELHGKLASLAPKVVFLIAATLRPETMHGQTNCWLGPDLNYITIEAKNGDVYVCTKRAARNMAYQGMLRVENKVLPIVEMKGYELMGTKLTAPLTSYKTIYTLPMMTVKEDKGTGVVTSVPSDAPDDFAALIDLKNKPALREKYGITEEMVNVEPVPIIDVPEFGTLISAPSVCQMMGIKSQNDKEKLVEAKEKVYLRGFYEGTLIIGEFKGKKVQEIKKAIQEKLVKAGEAELYQEPEKQIISRSGDECVVALCDQWYLDYGESEWRKQVEQSLSDLDTYHGEVRRNFEATIDWLKGHTCARTYGLGTRLPWDEKWVIESLSDSTIYMAYYTFNLRASGKDLVPNHLTYYLYNHTAIWPTQKEMWPTGIRANGHLLLNSEKMSKSTGIFLTLTDALDKYGADGMRLALANAGDSIEDANFETQVADSGVLRLWTFVELAKELMIEKDTMRSGPNTVNDKMFIAEMNLKIRETEEHYKTLMFKESLRTGFFEYSNLFHQYHLSLTKASEYLAEASHCFRLRLKSHMTSGKGKKGETPTAPQPPSHGIVWVAKTFPKWQSIILTTMHDIYKKNKSLPDNKELSKALGSAPSLKKYMKKVMPFVQAVRERMDKFGESALKDTVEFDECSILEENMDYLQATLDLEGIELKWTEECENERTQEEVVPGEPYLTFFNATCLQLELINPQPHTGLFQAILPVYENDNLAAILNRLKRCERSVKPSMKITFHRFKDPVLGPRVIPTMADILQGTEQISEDEFFSLKGDSIHYTSNGSMTYLGTKILYLVQ